MEYLYQSDTGIYCPILSPVGAVLVCVPPPAEPGGISLLTRHLLLNMHMFQVNLEEAAEGLPDEYGNVENRFRVGFNEAYFEQLCSDEGALSRWSTQLALLSTREDFCCVGRRLRLSTDDSLCVDNNSI